MKHLVIGAGEVGRAVHEVLSRVYDVELRDIEPVSGKADVLHICFPWSDQFVQHVHDYVREYGANLVVVYSTVPVGTCDPERWVHSPVTGVHPHLAASLLSFRRAVGGSRALEAAELWMQLVNVHVRDRAAETEAAKLWELIQYGVQIRVEKAIYNWCQDQGLDYDFIYRQSAIVYNRGYTSMGLGQVVRPVLQHVPGPIGGHCVLQNSPMIDHPLAEMVVEWDD